MKWAEFKVTRRDFDTDVAFERYMRIARCALCHKMLKLGDLFDIRTVQTKEDDSIAISIIVHKKCLEVKQ